MNSKIPTINNFCNWLCFGKVKNIYACHIGFFLALPIALFFAITVGLIFGGGWTEKILVNLLGLSNYQIIIPLIIIGSIIGFLIICILFLGIGANIGNFIGEVVSKVINRK